MAAFAHDPSPESGASKLHAIIIGLVLSAFHSPPSGPVVWTEEKLKAAQDRARSLADSIVGYVNPSDDLEPHRQISADGPVSISNTRRWLARQLMDSRLEEAEALGIVAHHPAVANDGGAPRHPLTAENDEHKLTPNQGGDKP